MSQTGVMSGAAHSWRSAVNFYQLRGHQSIDVYHNEGPCQPQQQCLCVFITSSVGKKRKNTESINTFFSWCTAPWKSGALLHNASNSSVCHPLVVQKSPHKWCWWSVFHARGETRLAAAGTTTPRFMNITTEAGLRMEETSVNPPLQPSTVRTFKCLANHGTGKQAWCISPPPHHLPLPPPLPLPLSASPCSLTVTPLSLIEKHKVLVQGKKKSVSSRNSHFDWQVKFLLAIFSSYRPTH